MEKLKESFDADQTNEEEYQVSSELYEEYDYVTNLEPLLKNNNVVSKFSFESPPGKFELDNDGDMIVQRKCITNQVEIEHSKSTVLELVGLQIWRGALLLADWLLFNGDNLPKDITILELGSGVGLTSIIGAIYAPVICTDINKDDILDLIKTNISRNQHLVKFSINVTEIDFSKRLLPTSIQSILHKIQLILAADVIYDNQLTEDFVYTVKLILSGNPSSTVYVALEKRYVFTIADCDSVAPCYQYFLECIKNENLLISQVLLDFPQYFKYNRVKELVMCKINLNV